VVPFVLLVPVFGLFASNRLLGEGMQSWKIWAACFILSGLMVHLFGAQIFRLFKRRFWRRQNT
jgi:O-acetylserine/cysteine efflux transporter